MSGFRVGIIRDDPIQQLLEASSAFNRIPSQVTKQGRLGIPFKRGLSNHHTGVSRKEVVESSK